MAFIIIIGSIEEKEKKPEERKTLFYYLQLDVLNFVSKINIRLESHISCMHLIDEPKGASLACFTFLCYELSLPLTPTERGREKPNSGEKKRESFSFLSL